MRSFSFCPKGKKKQHPQGHKNKQGKQEYKQRTTKAKPQKISKEEKQRTKGQKQGKKEEKQGQTRIKP